MLASFDTSRYVTADEYLVHPAAREPGELVRGKIRVMSPAGGRHGMVCANVFSAVNDFVRAQALGRCFPDNTGFHLTGLPDTVRSPDVAFVSTSRLPSEGIGPGWMTATPDLVVEVRSPDETPKQLEEKLADYRVAGTRLFWIIDPVKRTVAVRDGDAAELQLTQSDTLTGGSALPGFTCEIARLFEGLAP